jgi:hypothetical protein
MPRHLSHRQRLVGRAEVPVSICVLPPSPASAASYRTSKARICSSIPSTFKQCEAAVRQESRRNPRVRAGVSGGLPTPSPIKTCRLSGHGPFHYVADGQLFFVVTT